MVFERGLDGVEGNSFEKRGEGSKEVLERCMRFYLLILKGSYHGKGGQ